MAHDGLTDGNKKSWGCLLHLGYNMWEDREAPEIRATKPNRIAQPSLRCDQGLWDEVTNEFAAVGGNLLIIDLGEAVQYESHPEIACKNAWSVKKLKAEIKRLHGLGIEAIPKLNFSAAHDTWLGPYERCVSTDTYYAVCRNLIEEVIDIFDQPRLFHLGMDEETFQHQKYHAHVVVRQHELWWHDLRFLVDQVERGGVRAWVWADALWIGDDPEGYLRQMPKSVLQSNWYYGDRFDKREPGVKAYLDLEEHGFDQMPTGSNHRVPANFERTVKYLTPRCDPSRLQGFIMATWRPTLEQFDYRKRHLESVQLVGDAIRNLG